MAQTCIQLQALLCLTLSFSLSLFPLKNFMYLSYEDLSPKFGHAAVRRVSIGIGEAVPSRSECIPAE